MKKSIATIILLIGLALNVFAQNTATAIVPLPAFSDTYPCKDVCPCACAGSPAVKTCSAIPRRRDFARRLGGGLLRSFYRRAAGTGARAKGGRRLTLSPPFKNDLGLLQVLH
jgi:hypothetical protein